MKDWQKECFAGPTPEQRAKRKEEKERRLKAAVARRKRDQRARDKENEELTAKRLKQRARDLSICKTKDWLLKFCTSEPHGCLIWHGPVGRSWERILPVVRAGAEAQMFADRAMWEATHGRPVQPNCWLGRTCGDLMCIEPSHLLEVNRVLARHLHSDEVADNEPDKGPKEGPEEAACDAAP